MTADFSVVRPSRSYADTEKLFGWNYVDWVEGWPVVIGL